MYVQLRGEEGERFQLRPAIEVVVLEVSPRGVKFGLVEPAPSGQPQTAVPEPVAQGTTRSPLRGYYRFLQGGQRMFVFTCNEGECLWNDGQLEVVVLQREGRNVVLGCRRLSRASHRPAPSPQFPAYSACSSRPAAAVPAGV